MSVSAQIRQMDAEADAAARAEYEQANAVEAARPVTDPGCVRYRGRSRGRCER